MENIHNNKGKNPYGKYFVIFLCLAFGICWGGAVLAMAFSETLVPIFGELNGTNPLVAVLLFSPGIAGLAVYFIMGKQKGLAGIFKKLVPERKDLIWFPVIFLMAALFYAVMRAGSVMFGIDVPAEPFKLQEGIYANMVTEAIAIIGAAFGWIGFLLPYFMTTMKKNGRINVTIKAGAAAGLLFGLFVMPGYVIDSFETATAYPFYVAQLMAFTVFAAYVFNATKGNLLIYIITFALLAGGSMFQFYYFIPPVQMLQTIFFILLTALIHVITKRGKVAHELQTLPVYAGKERACL